MWFCHTPTLLRCAATSPSQSRRVAWESLWGVTYDDSPRSAHRRSSFPLLINSCVSHSGRTPKLFSMPFLDVAASVRWIVTAYNSTELTDKRGGWFAVCHNISSLGDLVDFERDYVCYRTLIYLGHCLKYLCKTDGWGSYGLLQWRLPTIIGLLSSMA